MTSPQAFAATLDFPLDTFQTDAMHHLAAGTSVLVAAPTGAGKTVVGEFAIWLALQRNGKAFYTTPIKALSNQKYNDLCALYGPDKVGLLTGDKSINGDAPIVVMTTEVLRNMLYERAQRLVGLHMVVLDEVHFLGDEGRGAVWEEVIIQLAAGVTIAALSATVSNAEEFGLWLSEVRQGCEVIISEVRPVPLDHHYAVNGQLLPMFEQVKAKQPKQRKRRKGKLSPEEEAANEEQRAVIEATSERPARIKDQPRAAQHAAPRQGHELTQSQGHGQSSGQSQAPGQRDTKPAQPTYTTRPNHKISLMERQANSTRVTSRGRRIPTGGLRAPYRSDVVQLLDERDWLPAIVFIFSRKACDDAVTQVLQSRRPLTNKEERGRIEAFLKDMSKDIPREDLRALEYGQWSRAVMSGVAAHHAGMLPLFKEAIEHLFTQGLIKVVFATETLALGINMPARTVVIEKLEKWNGYGHVMLSPGQFTQLTGRAGRRGKDVVGHAVVLYQRDIVFDTVSGLVGRRTERLQSRFVPTYNMTVNLLGLHDVPTAKAILSQSFAQFQADLSTSGHAEQIQQNLEAMTGYREGMHSDLGDAMEYWAIRQELTTLEKQANASHKQRKQALINQALTSLEIGAVTMAPMTSKHDEMLCIVVQHTSPDKLHPSITVVTEDGQRRKLYARDYNKIPRQLAYVTVPTSGSSQRKAWRNELAGTIPKGIQRQDAWEAFPEAIGDSHAKRSHAIQDARARMRAHPVHTDPNLETIEFWGYKYNELEEKTKMLQQSVTTHTTTLVARFTQIMDLLRKMGYLHHDQDKPTPQGQMLANIHGEMDLLLCECLNGGLANRMRPDEMAAWATVFVYESRKDDAGYAYIPPGELQRAWQRTIDKYMDLIAVEDQFGLPTTRPMDATMMHAMQLWASEESIDEVLYQADMSPGDFVRVTKMTADLLRQIMATTSGHVQEVAREAHGAIMRDIVDW